MSKCTMGIVIKKGLKSLYFSCQLEKDHKGKHRYEGKSEDKLFRIEWWNELPVIEGPGEMYIEESHIETETEKMIRDEGYYWIKIKSIDWQPALYSSIENWWIIGTNKVLTDIDIDEIGNKIIGSVK